MYLGFFLYFLDLFSLQELISSIISDYCRKDTHGVFAEPVDPEEVHLLVTLHNI